MKKLLFVGLLMLVPLFGQRFDPFQPSDPVKVQQHCIETGYMLAPDYRVEVMWDVKEKVKPNCELMVGVPNTDNRTYRALTLPTWATPSQIAGMIAAEIEEQVKAEKQAPWWSRLFGKTKPELTVKGPVGLYVVTKFSAQKLIDE